LFKVHEEHPDMGIFAEIPHRLVLPIAIIVGKRQPRRIEHPHKPWITAFIRTRRKPAVVARGQKEHIRMFDELSCWGIDVIPGARGEMIRQAPRVEVVRVLLVNEQKMSKCGSSPRPDTACVSLAVHSDVEENLLNRRDSTLNVEKSQLLSSTIGVDNDVRFLRSAWHMKHSRNHKFNKHLGDFSIFGSATPGIPR
jgi:hypothetical protein